MVGTGTDGDAVRNCSEGRQPPGVLGGSSRSFDRVGAEQNNALLIMKRARVIISHFSPISMQYCSYYRHIFVVLLELVCKMSFSL